jgi:ATP-dependent DNA helicase PIF1
MPFSLRRLFATILVFCEPSDVHGLWERHLEGMIEDYLRLPHISLHAAEQMALLDIQDTLQSMGKDISSFPLLEIEESFDATRCQTREIVEESMIELDPEHVHLAYSLNPEQMDAYNEILSSVESENGSVFFLDGHGGTGNTFLYKALLAKVRSEGKIVVAMTTSGVAASILPRGRTAHSRFKIPLNIEDNGVCSFTKQSGKAKLLTRDSLIIWDETSMTKQQAVEALDSSMRDIMGRYDLPFGGKIVVFGGDFRQVLPVIHKGTRTQITDATLCKSHIWESMRQLN